MDPRACTQVSYNNVLFPPIKSNTSEKETPEMTAIFSEQCSSLAIYSAASISKVP